jgi:hypothetical protein
MLLGESIQYHQLGMSSGESIQYLQPSYHQLGMAVRKIHINRKQSALVISKEESSIGVRENNFVFVDKYFFI